MPMRERRSSPANEPTDLNNVQRAAIDSITAASSPKGGRPTEKGLREIVHALISIHGAGRQWRIRPADVPPISVVRHSLDRWKRDGTFIRFNDAPHKQARQAPGRDEEPSLSVFHAQAAKRRKRAASAAATQKRSTNASVNRKRQCRIDTDGLLLRALIYAAGILEVKRHYCFLRIAEIRVDQGCKTGLERRLAQHPSIQIAVIEKLPEQKGRIGGGTLDCLDMTQETGDS